MPPEPQPDPQPTLVEDGQFDPLAVIPPGSQWAGLRQAFQLLKRDFPDKWKKLVGDQARVMRMLQKDPDVARDDIFEFVIGSEALQETYGITAEQAEGVILGKNEGGINFSSLNIPPPAETGNPTPTPGAPGLRIMGGKSLQWYYDPRTKKYYASYTMPGTNQQVLFEANEKQMKELFAGRLPEFSNINFNQFVRRENIHFGGNITEVEGTGNWEQEFQRTVSLALDQRDLPDWIKNDPQAMALLFIATSENRSDDWFYEQLSNLQSFKKRYPGLDSMLGEGVNVAEAVMAFDEYEQGLKRLHAAAGFNPSGVSHQLTGDLMKKGYSLDQIGETYSVWKRIHSNATALKAFNEILVANGQKALQGKGLYDFLRGTAPAALYEIWSASAINEAAEAMGFGSVFGGQDALKLALKTEENFTQAEAFQNFQNVAQQALRLRHELNLGQYGLDIDDLIDLSFGQKPRSGKNMAQVAEAMQRIQQEAQGFVGGRVNPFIGFTDQGKPQARSFGEARQVT